MFQFIINYLNLIKRKFKQIFSEKFIYVFSEKVLLIFYSIFIGTYVLKYLGVVNAGLYTVILSYMSIYKYLGSGGLNDLNIFMLNYYKNNTNKYIKITYYIQFLYSFIGSFFFVFLTKNYLDIKIQMIIILSVVIRFNNVNRNLLEAQENWKKIFYNEFIIISVISILRITGIYLHLNIYYFLLILFVESLLYLFFYKSSFIFFKESISINEIKFIILKSFPFLYSGLIVMVTMKLDMLLSKLKMNNFETGYYSIGIKFSEALYFIPIALADFITPKIATNVNDPSKLISLIQLFYNKYIKILYLIVFFIFLISDKLILYFFGEAFFKSIIVLKIHSLTLIFVFLGIVGSKYHLVINNKIFILFRSTFSMILYLILIYFFANDALTMSILVLIFQIFNSFLIDIFYPQGRILFKIKFKSLFLIPR